MMLIIFGLPIMLIVIVIAALTGLLGRRPAPVFSPPTQASTPATALTRYCSHCGQGLQADWTHCLRCGAPIDMK